MGIKEEAQEILDLFRERDYYKRKCEDLEKSYEEVEKERNNLLYKHEDSNLKRDQPLNAKFRYAKNRIFWLCPQCDGMISNWQKYCHFCGQLIGSKEYKPEYEVKEE